MEYSKKKRRESYWENDPDTGLPVKKKYRMVERYEWISDDGTIYRSHHTYILDKRSGQNASE